MSQFQVNFKGQPYYYATSDHELTDKAFETYPGIYKCSNENQAVRLENNKSIVYHTKQCDYTHDQYKEAQEYSDKINVLCQYPRSHTTTLINQTADQDNYKHRTLEAWCKDLENTVAQPDIVNFIKHTVCNKSKVNYNNYWDAFLKAYVSINAEIKYREKYHSQCVCVADKGHISRLILLQRLQQALGNLLLTASSQLVTVKAYPTLVSDTILFADKTIPFDKQYLFGLFTIVQPMISPRDETKGILNNFVDAVVSQVNQSLYTLTKTYAKQHTINYSNKAAFIQSCEQVVSPSFYKDNEALVKKTVKAYALDAIADEVTKVKTYYTNVVDCVDVVDSVPVKILINFDQLQAYLHQKKHITFDTQMLHDSVHSKMKLPAYNACFKGYHEDRLDLLLKICEHFHSLAGNEEVKNDLLKFCPNPKAVIKAMAGSSTYKPLVQGAWATTTGSVTSNKGKISFQKISDSIDSMTDKQAEKLLAQIYKEYKQFLTVSKRQPKYVQAKVQKQALQLRR